MTPDEYDCEDTRSALAAYVAGALPREQAQRVARHLAQCAQCASEAHEWWRIGALARDYPATAPTPPFADAWAQLQTRLASERATPRMSVPPAQRLREVQLDDITSAPSAPVGAARTLKPIRSSGPMRHTRTFAAAAAALALVVISVSVFSALIRQRQGGTHIGALTTTACAPSQISAKLPPNTQLADLAMTSPTDGWAVGNTVTPNQVDEPLIMRYHDCRWAPFTSPALNGLDNVALNSLSMVSADEGWATGYPASALLATSLVLLHEQHGAWSRVAVPTTLGNGSWFTKVAMTSDDTGWFLVNTPVPYPSQVKWTNALAQYSHGVWKVITPPFPFVGDIAAVASNDVFISGAADEASHQSLLGLYHNGVWTTWAAPGVQLGALRMLSPTDGWVVADIPSPSNMSDLATLTPLHFNGATWSRANLGIPSGAYEVGIVSSGDLWAFNGGISYHYQQGQWMSAPLPQNPPNLAPTTKWDVQSTSSVAAIGRTSDGAYWTLGAYQVGVAPASGGNEELTVSTFMRYANGAWTEYGAA